MKNDNTIHEQATANREQWFQYRRTLTANLSTLEALYSAQYDEESPLYRSTPEQTVAAFVESVGYEAAVEIVASLVNCSAWDGRISLRCAEWANAQENSWDEEACIRLQIYSDRIHKVHLDQIAEAMMKYEPTAEEAQAESTLDKVTAELRARKDRSAWNKGVTLYALELVEELKERAEYEGRNPEPGKECREWMLNGAQDWNQYSWGGCSLIYNGDIAERLCCPSELKRTCNGERRPNSREEWLDTQARALYQAANRVSRLYRSIYGEMKVEEG